MNEEREREVKEALARLRERYDPTQGQSQPEEIAQDFDKTSFDLTDDLSKRVRDGKEGYLLSARQDDLNKEAVALERKSISQEQMDGLRHEINLGDERRRRDIENDPKWLKVRGQIEENHARDYETISEQFGKVRDETLTANGHDPDPATWEINQKREVPDAPPSPGTPPQELPLWEAAEKREAALEAPAQSQPASGDPVLGTPRISDTPNFRRTPRR